MVAVLGCLQGGALPLLQVGVIIRMDQFFLQGGFLNNVEDGFGAVEPVLGLDEISLDELLGVVGVGGMFLDVNVQFFSDALNLFRPAPCAWLDTCLLE